MKQRSLAARSLVAVGLMIGFYVLALGIVAGLLYLPYAELAYLHRVDLRLLIFSGTAALAIGWAILPRRDRFVAPGPELARERHPALFARLDSVAKRTGQKLPKHVFLVSDLNAWVASRGGFMGFGSRRVMGIGLPLLQVTNVSQLEAVLAHEFGHYHGGDTRLGPWVYKTRSAIGRTLASLGDEGWLHLPFRAYGSLFLGITQSISRAQELSADRLSARVVGVRPLVEGLKRIHATAGAYQAYWHQEAAPVLDSGFRPPLARGFEAFLSEPRIQEVIDQTLKESLESTSGDPFDSHPPLAERIAAVEAQEGTASAELDTTPALSLLGDLDACERALLTSLSSPEAVEKLRSVEWAQVTELIYLPGWRRQAESVAELVGATTLAGLPSLVRERGLQIARRVIERPAAALEPEHVLQLASGAIGASLVCVLLDRGFTVATGPGQPVALHRGETMLEPFAVVRRLAAEGDAWWAEWVTREGVADVRLGYTGASAAA